jgi:hypothetical protein
MYHVLPCQSGTLQAIIVIATYVIDLPIDCIQALHQETSFCSRTGDCALGAPVGENLSNAFEPAHVESVSQAISVDEITRSLIDKLAKI